MRGDWVNHERRGIMITATRAKKISKYAAVPVGLFASGFLVLQASHAAFTAQTNNPGNSWSTGNITLTDDAQGTALFNVDNISPGQDGDKDIKVTFNGSSDAKVKLYATDASGDDTLAEKLQLNITRSQPGATSTGTSVFQGTLKTFEATQSFANGLGEW